jgi:solute carrier family 8 (sodium/calcium exchanger)
MDEEDEEGEQIINYDDDAEEDEEPILEEDGEPIDCEEGVLTFRRESMELWVGDEEMEVPITVVRKNGSEGRISAQYRMDGISATPGYDYEEDEGQLDFKSGITQCEIMVLILPKRPGEMDDVFQVILEDPDGGCILNPDSDGGDDACILTLILHNSNGNAKGIRAAVYRFLDKLLNMDEIWLGTSTWWEQILEAVFVNGSLEEQREAHWTDWVSHLFCFPWAFWYALLTPPPVYVGGWLCFGFALIHIGVLTSIIGDMAELFGCCAGIADAITAVTFVALGTSLPDTFASKTAATQDEWADASIVNVTGSNSVNVFLGIGIPWVMAAVFWKVQGPTEEWIGKYPDEYKMYPEAGFVVTGAGDLAFSVTVFTIAALICLTVIVVRRKIFGGELGGPPDMKATSSFLLIMLWVTYIFVCVSLIGLRMVVFFMFQLEG